MHPSTAILIFSHGSVLCGAERNLLELAGRMRERGDARVVEVGFLNYSEPSFDAAVDRCIEQGATRICVAPYFLVAGKFVKGDLPPLMERAREKYPQLDFVVADAIRFHPALADALLQCAAKATAPSAWRDVEKQAAEFCRNDPRCPNHGGPGCQAGKGHHH
jgi:sirohydrochlorin ferrochelatase